MISRLLLYFYEAFDHSGGQFGRVDREKLIIPFTQVGADDEKQQRCWKLITTKTKWWCNDWFFYFRYSCALHLCYVFSAD